MFFWIKRFLKIERNLHFYNYTPLHIAAEKNSKEIGELLILKGADINPTDINSSTILLLFESNYINNKKGNSNKIIEPLFI